MRIAVVGGGGFRVPLVHDALRPYATSWSLIDVSASRCEVVAAVLDDPTVSVAASLDEGLDGADLVVSAVRVGGVEGRVADERRALDLGVLGQETVGAGGLAYARRSLPVVRAHAEAIARRAPGAWTLTMTNPAGIVTEVMGAVLGPRVLGICDSPSGLVRRVAGAVGLPLGAAGTVPEGTDYLGINHLGWLRGLPADGLGRFLADPELITATEEGRLFGADLVTALGAVPNEYLYWYYAAAEALAGVREAGRTRAEHVRAQQDAFYRAAAAEPRRARALWFEANDERNRSYFAELRADERDETDVAAGGYETVAAATVGALTGATPPATVVLDVPAGDAVPGLPPDLVVEVPCRVDPGGATPLPVTPPTDHQRALMTLVRDCERHMARAALDGDRGAALLAFTLHPLIGSRAAAEALVAATDAARAEPAATGAS